MKGLTQVSTYYLTSFVGLEDMRTLEGIDTLFSCNSISLVTILLEDMRTLEGIDTLNSIFKCLILYVWLEDMRTIEGIDTLIHGWIV